MVGQEGDDREPDWPGEGVGKEGQMAEEGGLAGSSRARWQLLGVWGQEEGWQGARCGRGSGSKEGQMVREGGDGMVQEGQMGVAGVVGW